MDARILSLKMRKTNKNLYLNHLQIQIEVEKCKVCHLHLKKNELIFIVSKLILYLLKFEMSLCPY